MYSLRQLWTSQMCHFQRGAGVSFSERCRCVPVVVVVVGVNLMTCSSNNCVFSINYWIVIAMCTFTETQPIQQYYLGRKLLDLVWNPGHIGNMYIHVCSLNSQLSYCTFCYVHTSVPLCRYTIHILAASVLVILYMCICIIPHTNQVWGNAVFITSKHAIHYLSVHLNFQLFHFLLNWHTTNAVTVHKSICMYNFIMNSYILMIANFLSW